MPLAVLQRALGQEGRANVILASASSPDAPGTELATALGEALSLDDRGLRLRTLPAAGALQLETASGLVDDDLARRAADVARRQGLAGERAPRVPRERDDRRGARGAVLARRRARPRGARGRGGPRGRRRERRGRRRSSSTTGPPRASARPPARGSRSTSSSGSEEGRLETARAEFDVVAVTTMTGLAADRDLVPDYPGITESLHLADWDPPFPVDLDRIRPEDEAYWDRHRATPKAFVPLAVGQRLWGHRQGRTTALRLTPPPGTALEDARRTFADGLLADLRQGEAGPGATWAAPAIVPVRRDALEASRGSTDFGEYFAYFSFFLVVAGLLLAGLFFRLGLEQRLREVGLLEALGFTAARLRRHYLVEGLVLAGLGGLLGALAAGGYAAAVLWGLRTLWADALGTRDLVLHLRPWSPLLGAARRRPRGRPRRGVDAARPAPALSPLAPRGRSPAVDGPLGPPALRGRRGPRDRQHSPWRPPPASARCPDTAGFFGAGSLLLAAALLLARQLVARRPRSGARRAQRRRPRPARALVPPRAQRPVRRARGRGHVRDRGRGCLPARRARPTSPPGTARAAAIASWPGLSRRCTTTSAAPRGRRPSASSRGTSTASGSPASGRGAATTRAASTSTRPASRPSSARRPSFLRERRFSFQSSLAETDEERANPWLLLERAREPGGAIPVVADAGTLAYALHRKLGDEMPLGATGARVRFVAALGPGLLQGELLMGERHFLEAFPGETGDRFFLFDVPEGRADALATRLESRLSDFGFDVGETAARLRDLHRVENTYIATFQALGALGLLLGSVGLATVLVRNALEQRGELALLRAVGYAPRHLARMALVQNGALVGLGFLAGAVPALLAVLPTLLDRRGTVPLALVAVLLLALAATSLLVSWLAVAFVRRLPLVASLRSE